MNHFEHLIINKIGTNQTHYFTKTRFTFSDLCKEVSFESFRCCMQHSVKYVCYQRRYQKCWTKKSDYNSTFKNWAGVALSRVSMHRFLFNIQQRTKTKKATTATDSHLHRLENGFEVDKDANENVNVWIFVKVYVWCVCMCTLYINAAIATASTNLNSNVNYTWFIFYIINFFLFSKYHSDFVEC